MRQLWQTGWMHNRVRMITASFLIKHLLIDWREGEKWFLGLPVRCRLCLQRHQLAVDRGDGVDSNMFSRIMAPLSQSEKFDAARYIRTYVPELKGIDEPYVHDPEEFAARGLSAQDRRPQGRAGTGAGGVEDDQVRLTGACSRALRGPMHPQRHKTRG